MPFGPAELTKRVLFGNANFARWCGTSAICPSQIAHDVPTMAPRSMNSEISRNCR